jgi:hypothetical protein
MSNQRIGSWPQLLATLYVDIHPPLFVTFMYCWNGVFGDGEFALRTPALLSGLACIPLVWWTGRRLVGDTAAMWAALLLTLSAVHVWYSAEARLYAPMTTCAVLAFGTFDRLLEPGDGRRRGLWCLHLANVAVMLGLHYYLGVLVIALAVLAPVVARGFTRAARGIVLAHGIGILLLGAFVLAKHSVGQFETGQDYLRALDLGGLWDFAFGWCWTGDTLTPRGVPPGPVAHVTATVWRGLGVGLVIAGIVHVVRGRRRHPNGWLVLVGMLTLPCFLLGCAMLGYDDTYLERTLIPSLPFLLLLASAGLLPASRRLRNGLGGVTAAFFAAGLIVLYARIDTHWMVYKPSPDWRSAARWLGEQIDGGATGRPVFTSMPNPRSLSYYDPRIQDAKNLAPATSPDEIRASVAKRLGQTLGDFAAETFRAFDDHNTELLQRAALVVRRSQPDPSALELPPDRPDDVCYLVRNHWHPHVSVDGSVETLLEHPAVERIEAARFAGVSVYKIRLSP